MTRLYLFALVVGLAAGLGVASALLLDPHVGVLATAFSYALDALGLFVLSLWLSDRLRAWRRRG